MALSGTARLAVVATIAALQLPNSASAGKLFSFMFAAPNGVGSIKAIRCKGPWGRSSSCVPILNQTQRQQFYVAEDTLFSAIGDWRCEAYDNAGCHRFGPNVSFCGPGDGGHSDQVDLVLNNPGDLSLTVDQAPSCSAAAMTSVLGQNGEDDRTPAQDEDTFTLVGNLGEQVTFRLGRDGSGGSAGEVATLRVRAASGAPLGQRTGAVPLSLEVTLPGTVEVAVSREPGHGDPLRGYYELEVIAKSGDIGERKLRPSANVEQ